MMSTKMVFTQLKPALWLFIIFTIVTGIIYPLTITGFAQIAFPTQANGSLIERGGELIGSELIAQKFSSDDYFWARPSAANYDATASSGSNLGATNPQLLDNIESVVSALEASEENPVPVDLVTASGSGLDPHISPAAAYYQARRVADARNLSLNVVNTLIADHIDGRTLGILGELRVNVLTLNLALDEMMQ